MVRGRAQKREKRAGRQSRARVAKRRHRVMLAHPEKSRAGSHRCRDRSRDDSVAPIDFDLQLLPRDEMRRGENDEPCASGLGLETRLIVHGIVIIRSLGNDQHCLLELCFRCRKLADARNEVVRVRFLEREREVSAPRVSDPKPRGRGGLGGGWQTYQLGGRGVLQLHEVFRALV